jgi:DDE family transposase
MRPLIWVSKSMDKPAEALTAMGHPISADTVRKLVKLGFSRQHIRKADKGAPHPDRNAQFEQCKSHRGAGKRPACDLGRRQEQGAGRQLQERRLGLAAERRSRSRESARFRGQGAWQRPHGIDGRRCACRRSSRSVGARRQAAMPLVDVGANADFVSVGIIQ